MRANDYDFGDIIVTDEAVGIVVEVVGAHLLGGDRVKRMLWLYSSKTGGPWLDGDGRVHTAQSEITKVYEDVDWKRLRDALCVALSKEEGV